ncbi:MAG: hypothetical protein FWC92_10755 [Defluviitaleaceae bacterium]|nr:hypothetical protein [Defluviitaleaceae bacterium]
MTEKPKYMVFLLIGIVALLFISISSNRRISRLEMQINHIANSQVNNFHEAQHTRGTLWEVQGRLDEVSEEIARSARATFDETVHIHAFHASTTTVDVEVSFNLREHNPADAISVTARGHAGQTIGAVASTSGDGRFAAAMTLPLQDNYTLTFTASGDTITTGELMHFNLADQLCGRFIYHNSRNITSGTNMPTTVSLYTYFRNQTNGNPELMVTSLVLYIETESGNVIASHDLTAYLQNMGDMQVLADQRSHIALVAGDEAGNISPDEFTQVRLVIRDNLQIRYEQIDTLTVPGQLTSMRSSNEIAVAPIPVREFHTWRAGDPTVSWGQIRIVE